MNTPSHRLIDEWPAQVEIYSHDREVCCWDRHRNVDSEKWCLRLECRPLYDPDRTDHDGRHQE
eukprot:12529778-Heterocapsa_arctica.AAC.1